MVDVLGSNVFKLAVVVDEDEGFVVFVQLDGAEQAHQVRQGEFVKRILVVNGLANQLGLGVLHRLQLFVHRVPYNQPRDERFRFLPEPEDAAECYGGRLSVGGGREDREGLPCCSTLLFHQRSTQSTRLAMVKFKPTPPHLRDASMIETLAFWRKLSMAFSRSM